MQYAKNKGFTYEDFLSSVDLKYSNFKGKQKESGINSSSIERIVSVYPDIDLYWLFTGEIKKQKTEINLADENELIYKTKSMYKEKYYSELEKNSLLKDEVISLMKINERLKKDNTQVSH